MSEATLVDAYLCEANLKEVNLTHADLTHADLRGAVLNKANLEYAILKYCLVYGISTWDIKLKGAVQKRLSICPYNTNSLFVNCLENAQLKLLEINNLELPKISKLARELQAAIEENSTSGEPQKL